jgi:hypothetical protein
VVASIRGSLDHHHGVGPYLIAGSLLLFLLTALAMRRVERGKARRTARMVRRLSDLVSRLTQRQQHLEHDRDQWRMMQAEEASTNRRLVEEIEMQRAKRSEVSARTPAVASTSSPAPSPTPTGDVGGSGPTPAGRARVQGSRPRHQVRRPAQNQPRLFDQDEEGGQRSPDGSDPE